MNPRQKQLLFFLSIFLTLSGTCGMLFGDPLLAGRIGTLFAGMGMAISIVQLFLPLEPPRDKTAQTSGLLLPPSYPQIKSPQKLDLILPFSYHYSLQKRQRQQRRNRDSVIAGIVVSLPLAALIFLVIRGPVGTPIDISNPPDETTSRVIQIVQNYCHAMIDQNYHAAVRGKGVKIGGELIPNLNTFTQKAQQANQQQGDLTNCAVKSGNEYPDKWVTSDNRTVCVDCYTFTVEMKRSREPVYFTNISIFIYNDPSKTYMYLDIDRL